MLGYLLYEGDSTQDNGEWGEHRVNVKLERLRAIDLEKHHLYKDVYIKYDGGICQIDHIYIDESAVFVIETKMLNGLVFGSKDDFYWTQCVTKSNHRQFLNPLMQNDTHVSAVKSAIGDDINVVSLVVFASNNKPKDCPDNVINIKELVDYITNYKSDTPIPESEMLGILKVFEFIQSNKIELIKQHREQIQKNKKLNKK